MRDRAHCAEWSLLSRIQFTRWSLERHSWKHLKKYHSVVKWRSSFFLCCPCIQKGESWDDKIIPIHSSARAIIPQFALERWIKEFARERRALEITPLLISTDNLIQNNCRIESSHDIRVVNWKSLSNLLTGMSFRRRLRKLWWREAAISSLPEKVQIVLNRILPNLIVRNRISLNLV